jgi:hypothetical protein
MATIIPGSLELFHVSDREYSALERLSPLNGSSDFQRRQMTNADGWLEELFEDRRPVDRVSRIGARFACGTLGECAVFALAEPRYKSDHTMPRYYRVRCLTLTRAPMALVGIAFRHKGTDKLNEIVDEYWQPKKDWNYWEFLCSDLEIIERVEVPPARDIEEAREAYAVAWGCARRLWP